MGVDHVTGTWLLRRLMRKNKGVSVFVKVYCLGNIRENFHSKYCKLDGFAEGLFRQNAG